MQTGRWSEADWSMERSRLVDGSEVSVEHLHPHGCVIEWEDPLAQKVDWSISLLPGGSLEGLPISATHPHRGLSRPCATCAIAVVFVCRLPVSVF